MKNFSYTSPLLGKDYHIFVKPDLYDLTNRQYEQYKQLCDFINWGRANPTKFCEEIFGVSLMDYQTYVFMRTWLSQSAVWCCSRNAGKSILGALYIMTRSMLACNHHTYIAANVGSQSIDTFLKIEKLTKNAIPSFKSLTDCFSGELVKSQAKSDGFIRDPSSFHFTLYNGSTVHTLNGNIGNTRGKRANLVFFDEAMNSSDELFTTVEPFCTQNNTFVLGDRDYDQTDMLAEPIPFQNQLIYASSAGRTDQYFYKKYCECSKRMDAGDKRYFCADIDCNVVLNATRYGVALPEALLTQEKIDSALRKDKEKAMQEYMNKFVTEGGQNQIIPRSVIIKNSKPYVPELFNIDNNSFYALGYDSARRFDNSTITIARFWEDPIVGWKMRFVNNVVLVDRLSKKKRMMNAPNQVEELKRLILDYNGEGVPDYQNILGINVDSGSGGGAQFLCDYISDDFMIDGIMHRGLIDDEYNEGDAKKFPNAVNNVLHMISPIKYKSQMFEEMIQMIAQGVVEFPEEYNGRGYVSLIYEVDQNGNRTQRYSFPDEEEEKKLRNKGIVVEIEKHDLDQDEEEALVQLDMMKTEICNIYRYKSTSGGKDRFELSPEKANILHDDRCYTAALLIHLLSDLRRSHITNRKRTDTENLVERLPMRKAKIFKMM